MDIAASSALVTGGASGLGWATAQRLADGGAKVVIVDLPSSPGAERAEQIGGVFAPAGVTDPEQVRAAVQRAGELAPLRVVVNCAGIAPPAKVLDREGDVTKAVLPKPGHYRASTKSIGDPAEDIVAGFTTFDATNVYFRVDVWNVECTPATSPAAPTISASGPTAFCAGGNVTLTASAGYSSYLWSNGATTPSITVSNAGSYTVTGTSASGCTSPASAPTTVTVNPLPVIISFSATPSTINGGDTSTISFTIANATSWTLGDSLANSFSQTSGVGSGAFNVTYSADNATGVDNVTLTIVGPCGATQQTIQITVN